MSLNISSNLVPQVVNNYNAYTGDDKMIGLADEVTLPKIKTRPPPSTAWVSAAMLTALCRVSLRAWKPP